MRCSWSAVTSVVLASASFAAATCQEGISAQRKSQATSAFASAQIAPGVVAPSFNPTLDVNPAYGSKAVSFGNVFSTLETTMEPTFPFTAEQGYDDTTTNYTTIIVDPDAPSPNAPALRFFLHRIHYNAHPCGTVDQTQVPYLSLTPLSAAQHRYIFLVYRQPQGTFTPQMQLADAARAPFNLDSFVKAGNLTLVGGNYMKQGLNSLGSTG